MGRGKGCTSNIFYHACIVCLEVRFCRNTLEKDVAREVADNLILVIIS